VTGLDEDSSVDGGSVSQVVDAVRTKVGEDIMSNKQTGGTGGAGEGRLLITGGKESEKVGEGGGGEEGTGKIGNALVLLPGQKSTVKKAETTTSLAISKRNKGVKVEVSEEVGVGKHGELKNKPPPPLSVKTNTIPPPPKKPRPQSGTQSGVYPPSYQVTSVGSVP
jgi:hypothetical protein